MKNLLKIFTDQLVHGAHIVGFGALGISLSVVLIMGLEIKPLVLLISYLTYLIIYNYNRVRELLIDRYSNPERVEHFKSKNVLMKYSILLYICIFAFSLLFSNIQTILLSLFILAGGILYTEGLKKVPILGWKSYYVSFFWALLILIVPLFYELKNFIPYYYLVAFIFIRGIVNTTYSDIKDIESDKARGVKALAAHWGKEKTLYILQIINMLSLTPIIIGIYKGDLPSIAIVMSLTVLNGVYYLTKSLYIDQNKIRIFTNLLIDGEYILWPIFIVIAKLLT